jgi:hypothetical protein
MNRGQAGKGRTAIWKGHDVKPLLLNQALEHGAQGGVIVDDQNERQCPVHRFRERARTKAAATRGGIISWSSATASVLGPRRQAELSFASPK